ncbi:AcrB/AcrD/AcrF family protein [Solitalea longa]|uniref:AcrB/AcrD/AcrF family protein n=2 Tax=Solitalea longa TaxID=2079460 RepID=A0A2S4ZYX2_9SPHI|nr:AcrB/AcrD/AcrF family protein [Solitalea longa]
MTMRDPRKLTNEQRIAIIEKSAKQVGKPVVYSTFIIIISFLPVFLLTGQEGKLFHPLAWTKTLVMLASVILAITFVPVMMSFFLKGKMRPESQNPISNFFNRIYEPILKWCLEWKKTVLGINILALIISIPMIMGLGREFMPPLDEGSLLFMPVTLPDVSNAEAKRILQIQDKIILSVPEVKHVLGKAGRASTATDNAPMSMIESIILLKPQSEWREGKTKDDIIAELNAKLQIPGVTNGWTQPIINRINMLSTGIRTDVGVKVYGQNLDTIYSISREIEKALKDIEGITDLYPEQVTGGKFLDIKIKIEELGRFGLSINDVNMIVESALGGMNLTNTVEGRERFSVSVRLAQDFRSSINDIKRTLIQTPNGPVPLSSVADIMIKDGPAMINSENAMLRGTVLFNVRGRDLGNTVNDAISRLNETLTLPKGYYIDWSGQWENQLRATKTLSIIVPIVLVIIFFILYMTYNQVKEAIITMMSVPFALIGGVFLVYFWGINISVAVAVGFIALFGVAVETGMLMVVYLDEAMKRMVREKGAAVSIADLRHYVIEGSAKRLRPKLMTVSVTLFGLVPILWSHGTGIDLMLPIALPMIGGMITSTIHVLLVTPIIFEMTKEYELKKHGKVEVLNEK